MASFTVNVPDEAVEDLVTAVALRLGVARPTTAAGKAALGEQFAVRALRDVWVDYVAQRAAQQARDQAAGW